MHHQTLLSLQAEAASTKPETLGSMPSCIELIKSNKISNAIRMGQKLTFPLAIKSRRSKLVHNVPPPKLARKCASEVRSSITALQRHLSVTESFVCSRLIGRTHMAEYRVYIMGPDGHFQNSVALDCADDDADLHGPPLARRSRSAVGALVLNALTLFF